MSSNSPKDTAGGAVPAQRSHAERWQCAANSFQRFIPDVESARIAASLARNLGPLGTFAFETVGDVWDRPALSRRDRSLFIIATLAAQARGEELVGHTQIGLRHGLSRIEIEEILLHVAAYAGFPAAMAAARRIDEGLRSAEEVERLSDRAGAEPKSDAERDADAARVLGALQAGKADAPAMDLQALTRRYGYLGEWSCRWVMGEIWARPELSLRDRALVTLAILVAQGATAALRQVAEHALAADVTGAEMEEMIAHLGLYVGMPGAMAAMDALRELLREDGA